MLKTAQYIGVATLALVSLLCCTEHANAQIGTIDYRPGYTVQQVTNHPANIVRPYYIQCPPEYQVTSIYLNVRRANAGSMDFSIYYPGGNTATTSITNTQTGYQFDLPNLQCQGGDSTATTTGIPIQLLGNQLLAITENSSLLGFPSTSTIAIIGTTTNRWLHAGLKLELPLTPATEMSTTTIAQGLEPTTSAIIGLMLVLAVIASFTIATYLLNATRS